VVLAPSDDVAAEYERKYEGACPSNELLKCMAYLAEHTNSTYGLRVELRRGTRAKTWEWAAELAAHDGTVMKQPEVFPFMESEDIVFDRLCEMTLKQYVEKLDLGKLPLVPTKVADVPKVEKPKVEVPKIVTPLEPEHPLGTVGWIVAGVGGATAIAGGVVLGMAASTAGGLHPNDNGAVPLSEAPQAKQVADNGTLGSVLVGVGVAVAAGGVVMAMLPGDPPKAEKKTTVTMVPTAGGAVLSISGSLP